MAERMTKANNTFPSYTPLIRRHRFTAFHVHIYFRETYSLSLSLSCSFSLSGPTIACSIVVSTLFGYANVKGKRRIANI